MAELVRVFCVEDPPPTRKELMELLSEEGFDIHSEDEGDEENEFEEPSWHEFIMVYREDQEPINLEYMGEEDSDEFSELRDELIEMLDDFEGSEIPRIEKHLNKSIFVISIHCLDESDDEGQAIVNALQNYLATNHDGLAYVEDEGFYASDELILET